MGALNLPANGRVHLDTQCLIYTVEQHPTFFPVLYSVWKAVRAGSVRIVTSEISILETLIGPYKSGDRVLEANYEQTLVLPGGRFGTDHPKHSSPSSPAPGIDHPSPYT